MSYEWGVWHDPDTEQGIHQYSLDGLKLATPHDMQAMGVEERLQVAQDCSNLLDNVYQGNYPQNTKETAALANSMGNGEMCMFTLSTEESRLIAMASLVRRRNTMSGEIGFAELSKAAKLQDDETATSVSVRHLSKYRLPWAFENMPDVDFIYGSPRAAAAGSDGAPGGRQAQSVWWGGRRHGVHLPLLASNVGWNFKVGGIEPLSGFVAPTDAMGWAEAVKGLPLFVPNDEIKQAIDTLFIEGTNGKLQPQTIIASSLSSQEPFSLKEARPPMAGIVTKYYATDQAEHLAERSLVEVDEQLSDAISQKIIIESDIVTTEHGAVVMRQLLEEGWSLAGWQPSEVVYGGICPIFARVNPSQLGELIDPIHYPQYFDEGGLGNTKRVLDEMYRTMYENAARRP